MSALSFGVIGVGHLGSIHAKLAAGIPELNLVGVCDLDPDRCREVAASCGCQAFLSPEDLLDQVQAVSIVVPTAHHYRVACAAVDRGCHLFVEKPITASSSQAEELIRHAEEANRILQVGHIERFNPAFQSLAGYPLDPLFIESHRLSQFNPRGLDVSVVLDLMIHDIDIVLALIPAPLDSIQACGVGVVSGNEDIANARLEFENGAVANLTASRISAKDMRKMRMFQSKAYIAIDFLEQKTEILHLDQAPIPSDLDSTSIGQIGVGEQARSVYLHTPQPAQSNALKHELQSFARSIRETTPPVVSGQDGLRALQTAEIILSEMSRRQKLAEKKAGF
ncbi:Gfo/Idh/MocA family protein [Desulfovermiculus halophilus]|uniref:Gfo/Idh/MocA family protein n=1 Tax=Desulfovermiculus halophilus TaxID=339722 RepID=UPI00047F0418|nr:Gfo/Idh/MocA family oxidoreductase [Desulfovermiculus halophilus]